MAKVTIFDSTLRLVETVTDLDLQSLNTLLDTQGHKDMCLSAREWGQLKELVEMLAPFLQAMDLTQGKKVVTLRAALTCVLSLNCHLIRMLILNDAAVELPFGDIVYLMSTLLDPSFCLFWLEQDVQAPDEVKSEVKEMMIDLVLAEARKLNVPESSSGDNDQEESPPAKTPRLFSGYRKKSTKKSVDHGSSVQAEVIGYIQVASDEDEVDSLEFWKRQSDAFP
ncbi:uncharacterized protein LOC120556812 [Perca fluviatilis]|uniref:uncharacterized protein LOC120556812 n=1 Tax=Perca fluviatilis TaxID=8168 RepID=UPI001966283D|nr:uncharacterized protein LOC120556812 [Perca fluviatilis]